MADRNNPNQSVGSRPIGAPAGKRPWWLIALAAVILIVLLLLLLSRCGGDDSNDTSAATAPTPTAASVTPTASPTPATTPSPAGTGSDGGAGDGTLNADNSPLLPLADATKIGADGSLSAYNGTDCTASGVAVQSVPADEGFWVGSSASDRVWVQLTGEEGESPFKVKKGDRVSFTGKVVKNETGFAKSAGVTDAEGKKLLKSQGHHIFVSRSALALAS